MIRSISGATVAFESLQFPGHFLNSRRDGSVNLDQQPLTSINVQFIVRVNVSQLAWLQGNMWLVGF